MTLECLEGFTPSFVNVQHSTVATKTASFCCHKLTQKVCEMVSVNNSVSVPNHPKINQPLACNKRSAVTEYSNKVKIWSDNRILFLD